MGDSQGMAALCRHPFTEKTGSMPDGYSRQPAEVIPSSKKKQ